jgi:DNA (cytosine-5)-methyltransferase 1
MPSGELFPNHPDPTALLAHAQHVFGKKALAEKLAVDRKTIGRWERSQKQLPIARQLVLREILRSVPKQTDGGDFTFIDLFAGIGGMPSMKIM